VCSCRNVLVRFDAMLVGSDTDGYNSRLESVALTPNVSHLRIHTKIPLCSWLSALTPSCLSERCNFGIVINVVKSWSD